MANNLRWQIMWKSITGESFVLDIYDNTGYQGDVVTLTGGAKPFVTQEDESEDYYTPIRTQSGNIEVLVTDPAVVNDLIPVKATDHQVVLRKDLGGGESEICWVGFISGEMFTQPWEPVPYVVTIPVVSVMEAMRGVMFTQDEGAVSLRNVMITIFSHIHQVSLSLVYPTFCRADLIYVINQNFREWVKPKKRANLGMGTDKYECRNLYDIVEDFCKYFGVSLHEDGIQFVFAVHDYEELESGDMPYLLDDLSVPAAPTQIQDMTTETLTLFGSDGVASFSPSYRRVTGRFSIGNGKGLEMFSIGNMWENYQLDDIFGPRSNVTSILSAFFDGDDEITPYLDNVPGVGPLRRRSPDTNKYGAQLAFLPSLGSGIWLQSIKYAPDAYAMKIEMERPIYLYHNDKNSLCRTTNVKFNIHAINQLSRDSSGFTGNIYFRLSIYVEMAQTKYWLKTTKYSGGLIEYTWVTNTENAFIPMKDGNVNGENIESWTKVENGISFLFPFPLSDGMDFYGPCNAELILLCNAEEDSEWTGEESLKSIFIDRLDLSYEYKVLDDFWTSQVSVDDNELCVVNSNESSKDYQFDSNITTSQKATSAGQVKYPIQNGTGIALTGSYDYMEYDYGDYGVKRRARLFVQPREVLTIPSSNRVGSYRRIQRGNALYALISRSTNWRDGITVTKIIRVS